MAIRADGVEYVISPPRRYSTDTESGKCFLTPALMSAALHDKALDSDSDDSDYVPPTKADSSSSDSEAEAESNSALVEPKESFSADFEARKRQRKEQWASFQASLSQTSTVKPTTQVPKMVKVQRIYRFAGETKNEVIEVPEDSPEANEWPRWTPEDSANEKALKEPLAAEQESTMALVSLQSSQPISPPESADCSTVSTSSPTPALPAKSTNGPTKRPGPRKPKTVLAPLPGISKPKKLTTLDKSAMDWQAHVRTEVAAGSSVKDELDAHKRSGGYLEKVEFLKRVEERKEERFETERGNSKRRKI